MTQSPAANLAGTGKFEARVQVMKEADGGSRRFQVSGVGEAASPGAAAET